jgi:biofilm protein TabA
MRRTIIYKLVCLIILGIAANTAFSQTKWTEKTAKAWADKGEWRNGFKPKLSPSVDLVQFAAQYHANKPLWDSVFTYLATTNLQELPNGTKPVSGTNAYGITTNGPLKTFDVSRWEVHEKYIDLQMVISGKEKMGMMKPPADAKWATPFNAGTDIGFYEGSLPGEYFVGDPDTLLIFFPKTSHRPAIKTDDGPDRDKKIVVKVKAAQL